MTEEYWKPVVGYEELYEVSSIGRVKSIGRKTFDTLGRCQYHSGRILKGKLETNGYLRVQLWKNGEGKMYSIHRLVAETYIPNPENLPQVNHKDENKTNNCVENLEWCDQAYNNIYGTRIERARQTRGENKSLPTII